MTKVHILETGVKFLDFVFESTHKIWIDRCDLQQDKEKSLGVTKEDKKLYSYDKNMVKKILIIKSIKSYPGSSGIY
ncbi:unnamed protein product [Rhizophagus irregularis]|nr:unnamed protein product [Rhizophagus irregularis]